MSRSLAAATSSFDSMGGEFEARLKRNTVTTRTSKSDGRELTVSNPLAIIEAKFSYRVLDRLYFPSFVAIERKVDGQEVFMVYEVIGVSPTHYQLPGVDSSMPTLLRREYLDTIKESWGKSDETWIDLAAIPTNYSAKVEGDHLEFSRAPYTPLPGAQAWLLAKDAVEKFLCVRGGEKIGTMAGFDLPFTVDMDNLIRFHCGILGFSLDYNEPIIYREHGQIRISKIGELVDTFFEGRQEGRSYTSSIEAISFDRATFGVKWSPVQYVFRHKYEGKLLNFHTQTGRSVSVTPGHSLFAYRDGKIVSLSSSSLQKGDFLVGTRAVPSHEDELIEYSLVNLCRDIPGVTLSGLKPGDFPSFGPTVPKWRQWRWKHFGTVPLPYWNSLTGEAKGAALLSYKRCQRPLLQRLVIDEDIARLLGYYAAEGHVSINEGLNYDIVFTLNQNDAKIIADLRRILLSKFGILPRVHSHGLNGIRVSLSHKILAHFFSATVGRGARKKRVPVIIMNSPLTVRRAFLQAWAEGDYGVTTSKGLMNDIMYLLMLENTAATSSEWKGDGHAVIEGRVVNANPRFQMKFPTASEMKNGTIRKRRGQSEPTLPTSALSPALRSLLPNPSHHSRGRLKVGDKLVNQLADRISKLSAYEGRESLNVEAARHDGTYRREFGRHIVRNGNILAASELLVQARDDFELTKQIANSELTFYEIERIEEVNPSSEYVYDVSVPGDENFLGGFGGLFCHNTGSGKSNLSSSLLRIALARDPSLKVLVLDIAGEYSVNLLDLLEKDARVVSTESFESEQEFTSSQAIPESLEEAVGRKAIEDSLGKVYRQGVERLSLQHGGGIDLGWIQKLLENTVDSAKAGGTAAKIALGNLTMEFYEKGGNRPSTKITDLDEEMRARLGALLSDLSHKVHEKSGLKSDIDLIIEMMTTGDFGSKGSARLTPEQLADQLAKGTAPRLNVLYLPDPMDARFVTERLIKRLLFQKKKYGNKQRVLILLDEAQEYIPDEHTDREFTTQSNRAVEQLLRQGRKYRLHCWLATQRAARLNVNALQQLHSYFVSTLPRMYDRMVIADTFAIPYEVLERSADLGTGEWIFVSFKATKQKNVPVFLKTYDNEKLVSEKLK